MGSFPEFMVFVVNQAFPVLFPCWILHLFHLLSSSESSSTTATFQQHTDAIFARFQAGFPLERESNRFPNTFRPKVGLLPAGIGPLHRGATP